MKRCLTTSLILMFVLLSDCKTPSFAPKKEQTTEASTSTKSIKDTNDVKEITSELKLDVIVTSIQERIQNYREKNPVSPEDEKSPVSVKRSFDDALAKMQKADLKSYFQQKDFKDDLEYGKSVAAGTQKASLTQQVAQAVQNATTKKETPEQKAAREVKEAKEKESLKHEPIAATLGQFLPAAFIVWTVGSMRAYGIFNGVRSASNAESTAVRRVMGASCAVLSLASLLIGAGFFFDMLSKESRDIYAPWLGLGFSILSVMSYVSLTHYGYKLYTNPGEEKKFYEWVKDLANTPQRTVTYFEDLATKTKNFILMRKPALKETLWVEKSLESVVVAADKPALKETAALEKALLREEEVSLRARGLGFSFIAFSGVMVSIGVLGIWNNLNKIERQGLGLVDGENEDLKELLAGLKEDFEKAAALY